MRLLALAILGLSTAAAQAQVVTPSSEAPICTDRPTNGNYACTVPAGMVQIEADLINWSTDRADGARVDAVALTNPVLKYGLTDSSDVQFNWSPHVRVRTRDAGGVVSVADGIGDLTIRYKKRLTNAEGALQLAVLPFVKLPTAPSDIGNGKVEGGIAVPINYAVDGGWTFTLGPQLNILADADGAGRHVGLTGLVNVAKSFGAITILNELWTSQDFDPAGTVRQYSYDLALVWLARPNLQFDVGANIGLNRNTPDVVSYVGLSVRF